MDRIWRLIEEAVRISDLEEHTGQFDAVPILACDIDDASRHSLSMRALMHPANKSGDFSDLSPLAGFGYHFYPRQRRLFCIRRRQIERINSSRRRPNEAIWCFARREWEEFRFRAGVSAFTAQVVIQWMQASANDVGFWRGDSIVRPLA